MNFDQRQLSNVNQQTMQLSSMCIVLAVLSFTFLAHSEVLAQQLDGINGTVMNARTVRLPSDPAGTVEPAEKGREEFMPTADAIRIFEARIRANPKDHFSMVVAAQLYLREGRETSQHASLEKAEKLLRQAIEIDPSNKAAQAWLISALVSQHKFREAVQQSETALELVPDNEFILSARADALMELGEIDRAESLFNKIAQSVRTPGVLARLGRIAELRGDPEKAISLVSEALAESISHEERAQTTAWYEYRLGTLCFDQGNLESAASHFEAGLKRNPDDPKLVNAMARIRVAEGNYAEAKELYEKSVWAGNSPTTMADYADLLKRMGQTEQANKWLENADRLMQRELATTGTAHCRDRAMFLLNHDRSIQQALELAKKDFETRQDIFAHDTLAWALLKSGQPEDALKEITQALQLGTRDATLYFHAAEIAKACDQPEQADKWMTVAKQINPHALCLK